MSTTWRGRLALLALPALAAGVAAVVIGLQLGVGRQAGATQGGSYAGHLSVGSCTANCTVLTSTFTVDLNLDTWTAPYDGIQIDVFSTTGDCKSANTDAMTTSWPHQFGLSNCLTSAEGEIAASKGAGENSASQKGKIGEIVFNCTQGGTLSLDPASFFVNGITAENGPLTIADLHVNCGTGPTDTPGPTNTPTITNTPGPVTLTPTRTATRTPTRTPPPGAYHPGDVNTDGHTNSLDALSILQADAHLIPNVPHPACGDLNHDGMINSIDALFVLQIDAGRLMQPSGTC